MTTTFAIALAIGFVGLIVVVFGGMLMENIGKASKDPNLLLGGRGRAVLGGLAGFGAAGMAADFSPLDLTDPLIWVISLLGGTGAAWWSSRDLT